MVGPVFCVYCRCSQRYSPEASGGLLVQQPELAISQQIAELIASNSPLHDTGMMAYAHYVGAGFALLFLLFWVRRSSLNRRIQSLQQRGGGTLR